MTRLSGTTRTVLLVEDNPTARMAIEALLEDLGYRVLSAGSAAEALELVGGHLHIDVVLTDIELPGMNGAELATRLRDLHPAMGVVYVTGRDKNDESSRRATALPNSVLLEKPVDLDLIAQKVHDAAEGRV